MDRIDQIVQRIPDASLLSKVPGTDTDAMRTDFPGIPEEYTDFLARVGFGEVENIRIYEGPTGPEDIYPNPEGDLSHIVLFGDDCQGYCFGFDMQSEFRLVDVDPRGNPRVRKEQGFLALVERYLSE